MESLVVLARWAHYRINVWPQNALSIFTRLLFILFKKPELCTFVFLWAVFFLFRLFFWSLEDDFPKCPSVIRQSQRDPDVPSLLVVALLFVDCFHTSVVFNCTLEKQQIVKLFPFCCLTTGKVVCDTWIQNHTSIYTFRTYPEAVSAPLWRSTLSSVTQILIA